MAVNILSHPFVYSVEWYISYIRMHKQINNLQHHFSLTFPFRLKSRNGHKQPEASWCQRIRSRLHPFYSRHSLIRGLRSPRGGSRLSKTDPPRSSAGFRGFLRCSWGTFPRITLIHDEWKHPEEKRGASRLHSAAQAPNLCWDSPQWERTAGTHIKHRPL